MARPQVERVSTEALVGYYRANLAGLEQESYAECLTFGDLFHLFTIRFPDAQPETAAASAASLGRPDLAVIPERFEYVPDRDAPLPPVPPGPSLEARRKGETDLGDMTKASRVRLHRQHLASWDSLGSHRFEEFHLSSCYTSRVEYASVGPRRGACGHLVLDAVDDYTFQSALRHFEPTVLWCSHRRAVFAPEVENPEDLRSLTIDSPHIYGTSSLTCEHLENLSLSRADYGEAIRRLVANCALQLRSLTLHGAGYTDPSLLLPAKGLERVSISIAPPDVETWLEHALSHRRCGFIFSPFHEPDALSEVEEGQNSSGQHYCIVRKAGAKRDTFIGSLYPHSPQSEEAEGGAIGGRQYGALLTKSFRSLDAVRTWTRADK